MKNRFFLVIGLIFFACVSSSVIFAEPQNIASETKDPFLSIGDKMKLSQKVLDISNLPYTVTLNGIIIQGSLRMAIINGETVDEGQAWKDFLVDKILNDRVILVLGDNRIEIILESEENNEKSKK